LQSRTIAIPLRKPYRKSEFAGAVRLALGDAAAKKR
jgi:hypothetical protein